MPCCNMDTTYKHLLCSNDIFWNLLSYLVCIISGGYTRRDFCCIFSAAMIGYLPKNLRMYRWYIFSYQWVLWQLLERQREIGIWSAGWRETYLHIDKLIYFSYLLFNFSCFDHIESLPIISWFWKFDFPIWALPILGTHPFSGSNLP